MVLSYKSICLRQEDVDCFKNYHLLNDMCISFYYLLLNEKHDIFKEKYLLLEPAGVSIILFDNDIDDLIDMFEALSFSNKDYIFIPINDNTNKFQIEGGTHWALAIYQKSDNTFYYLDSMCSFIKNTHVILKKMLLMIHNKDYKVEENYHLNICFDKKYQNNTYDCGVFVLSFTELVLETLSQNNFDLVLDKNVINKIMEDKRLDQKLILNIRNSVIKKISEISK